MGALRLVVVQDAAFEESLVGRGSYFEDISKDDECVIK